MYFVILYHHRRNRVIYATVTSDQEDAWRKVDAIAQKAIKQGLYKANNLELVSGPTGTT